MSMSLNMSLDDIIAKEGKGKAQKPQKPQKGKAGGGVSKTIKKSSARPVKQQQAGRGGGGTSVYVGNLSWETSWQGLKDHMKQAGTVLHADVMMRNDGKSQGCGLVSFASAKDARNAINSLHDSELDGRLIFVREDREA